MQAKQAFTGAEPEPSILERRLAAAGESARELITFADGVEDAGHPDLARRSRNVARETLWLLDQLSAERSARRAFQTSHDRLLAKLMMGQ